MGLSTWVLQQILDRFWSKVRAFLVREKCTEIQFTAYKSSKPQWFNGKQHYSTHLSGTTSHGRGLDYSWNILGHLENILNSVNGQDKIWAKETTVIIRRKKIKYNLPIDKKCMLFLLFLKKWEKKSKHYNSNALSSVVSVIP